MSGCTRLSCEITSKKRKKHKKEKLILLDNITTLHKQRITQIFGGQATSACCAYMLDA